MPCRAVVRCGAVWCDVMCCVIVFLGLYLTPHSFLSQGRGRHDFTGGKQPPVLCS